MNEHAGAVATAEQSAVGREIRADDLWLEPVDLDQMPGFAPEEDMIRTCGAMCGGGGGTWGCGS